MTAARQDNGIVKFLYTKPETWKKSMVWLPVAREDNTTLQLPHTKPETFKMYMAWLYSRQLPQLNTTSNAKVDVQWLVDAYALGVLVRDHKFQNAIMDLMMRCGQEIDSFPDAYFVGKMYGIARGSSPGRKLMVDLWACKADMTWI